MAGRLRFLLAVILCLLPAAVRGMDWTSAGSLPDKLVLPVCPHTVVELPWAYRAQAGEQVVDVEWRFKADAPGSAEVVLATQVNGHFFADASNGPRLEYMGTDAGVRLHDIKPQHSGTYSVLVNLEKNGVAQNLQQSVRVFVSDTPISSSDLVAKVQGARFMPSSQEFKLVLTCGNVDPVWAQRVDILWTTPSNQTLTGTYEGNGIYTLAIPNPVQDGDYSCKVNNSSPAAQCIRSVTALTDGASVHVDGVQARLSLMDSRISSMTSQVQGLQSQNGQLSTLLNNLAVNNSQLVGQVSLLQAENARLTAAMANMSSGPVAGSCNFDNGLCGYTQDTTDDTDWIRNSGPTGSAGTGPSADHTNSSGSYMYVEASTHEAWRALLLSPENAQNCGQICVSFYYHMLGMGMGTLNLRISKSTGMSAPLFTKSGNQGNTWNKANVTVPAAYLSLPYKIVFEGIVGHSYLSDMAIDDVKVTRGACH